jgi:hypothetical protein
MPDSPPVLTRSPSESPVSPPSLKRKDRPDDPLSSLPNVPQEEEYEAGRVICQVCGTGIAFRDEATNEFTMKHWDAHRLAWYYRSSCPRCPHH